MAKTGNIRGILIRIDDKPSRIVIKVRHTFVFVSVGPEIHQAQRNQLLNRITKGCSVWTRKEDDGSHHLLSDERNKLRPKITVKEKKVARG